MTPKIAFDWEINPTKQYHLYDISNSKYLVRNRAGKPIWSVSKVRAIKFQGDDQLQIILVACRRVAYAVEVNHV